MDTTTDRLFVADNSRNEVRVYTASTANGAVAPLMAISGLSRPNGLALW